MFFTHSYEGNFIVLYSSRKIELYQVPTSVWLHSIYTMHQSSQAHSPKDRAANMVKDPYEWSQRISLFPGDNWEHSFHMTLINLFSWKWVLFTFAWLTGIDLSSLVASQPSQGYLNLWVYDMVRLNPYIPYPKISCIIE